MRPWGSMLILVVGWGLGVRLAPAGGPADKVEPGHIAQLITQLGSHKFTDREEASKALDALGAQSLSPLRQACKQDDPEIRRRAEELVQRIEKRLETEKLLAPKRIKLVYKDVPLRDAVADFNRKTGLSIQILVNRTLLAKRKITMETADITLWEAFDQFCQKAGLAEPAAPAQGQAINARNRRERGLARMEKMAIIRRMELRGYPGQPFNGQITLVDGKFEVLPTYRAGAVRIRALPPDASVNWQQILGQAEKLLALEVTPEPTLQWHGILSVRIDKAVDDKGQNLSQVMSSNDGNMIMYTGKIANQWVVNGVPMGNLQNWPLRLKAGKNPSKALSQLEGAIAVEVQTPPEPLLTMDNILKAAGKEVKSKDGSALKVLEVDRQKDGRIKLRIQLSSAMGTGQMWGGNRVFIRRRIVRALPGGGMAVTEETVSGGSPSLSLQDAKGQQFRLVNMTHLSVMRNFNGITEEVMLSYQSAKSQTEAAKFVYSAPRNVIINIPFKLKDVPLAGEAVPKNASAPGAKVEKKAPAAGSRPAGVAEATGRK